MVRTSDVKEVLMDKKTKIDCVQTLDSIIGVTTDPLGGFWMKEQGTGQDWMKSHFMT